MHINLSRDILKFPAILKQGERREKEKKNIAEAILGIVYQLHVVIT